MSFDLVYAKYTYIHMCVYLYMKKKIWEQIDLVGTE